MCRVKEKDPKQTTADDGAIPAHYNQMALRILIVEDHGDTRRTLAGLLSRTGHEISTADCKQTALESIESKHFDVILSDINLPDGTGYDVISQAKRTHALKGVAISGLDGSEDLRRSKEAGFDFHLIKPLDFADLCGILNGFDLQPALA